MHNITDQEVITMFRRFLASNDSSEIDKLKAQDLAAVEARMGLRQVSPEFRNVIKNKIKDLELRETREYESKVRAWNLVTGFVLGLAVAGVSAWMFVAN